VVPFHERVRHDKYYAVLCPGDILGVSHNAGAGRGADVVRRSATWFALNA